MNRGRLMGQMMLVASGIALVVLSACGGEDVPCASGGCSGADWLIVILLAVFGFILSQKLENNADLLRSVYSDVKRLSRKVEELEERLDGASAKTGAEKKSAPAKKSASKKSTNKKS